MEALPVLPEVVTEVLGSGAHFFAAVLGTSPAALALDGGDL